MGKSATKAKNKYNASNYDRIGVVIPKGQKSVWVSEAERRQLSLNALVQKAVEEFIKQGE